MSKWYSVISHYLFRWIKFLITIDQVTLLLRQTDVKITTFEFVNTFAAMWATGNSQHILLRKIIYYVDSRWNNQIIKVFILFAAVALVGSGSGTILFIGFKVYFTSYSQHKHLKLWKKSRSYVNYCIHMWYKDSLSLFLHKHFVLTE